MAAPPPASGPIEVLSELVTTVEGVFVVVAALVLAMVLFYMVVDIVKGPFTNHDHKESGETWWKRGGRN